MTIQIIDEARRLKSIKNSSNSSIQRSDTKPYQRHQNDQIHQSDHRSDHRSDHQFHHQSINRSDHRSNPPYPYFQSNQSPTDQSYQNQQPKDIEMTLPTGQYKSSKYCSYCRRNGHLVDQCWQKDPSKRPNQGSNRSETALSTIVSTDRNIADITQSVNSSSYIKTSKNIKTSKSIKWILDSGASSHICCDRKLFRNIRKITNINVQWGNSGTFLPAIGKGEVPITFNSTGQSVVLKDVLFVPKFGFNLLSLYQAAQKGAKFKFSKDYSLITQSGQVLAKGYYNRKVAIFYTTSDIHQNDQIHVQSNKHAAALYNIAETTLRRRRAGRPARRDCQPNSKKLTKLEEEVIVDHILDLDLRGFSPTYAAVRDMADRLLATRGAGQVGVHWPRNFVNRTDRLTTRFNRAYDRQRALCEDPVLIKNWFELVEQTKAKYGICDEDVYNFNEAGFIMGKITTQLVVTASERRGRPKAVEPGNREWVTLIAAINAAGWAVPPFLVFAGQYHLSAWYEEAEIPRDWVIAIKHFNAHTKTRVIGTRRLLILDGHESHQSLEFQEFCKENNIYTLCMPPHSSHLLQPLDVGCFSPLKRAYSREVESLIRHHINHITKLEFLPAFKVAFDRSFTATNICSAFRGAGLVPLQPDAVLSRLDIKLRTPTPPAVLEALWQARTPSNTRELEAQSTLIRDRVQRHQGSSPASIIMAINQLKKGAEVMMLSAELMRDRIASLEKANEAATKRRQRKKKRIQKQGVLTKGAGEDLLAQREADQQIAYEERQGGERSGVSRQALARCSRCRETGHNSQCKEICKVVTLGNWIRFTLQTNIEEIALYQ
ncbi:hypothetical protein BM1_00655 [Bipolaris maydis]|nr:hypothetical protein BM1_00655 [Bipolaris maydis]